MHPRTLVFVAILAFLAATTAYLTHFHDPVTPTVGGEAHCTLCLELSGSAAAPSAARVIVFLALLCFILRSSGSSVTRSHRVRPAHQSRAPPVDAEA
jgi:hypothetical protein